jgi:hypothetical protein
MCFLHDLLRKSGLACPIRRQGNFCLATRDQKTEKTEIDRTPKTVAKRVLLILLLAVITLSALFAALLMDKSPPHIR